MMLLALLISLSLLSRNLAAREELSLEEVSKALVSSDVLQSLYDEFRLIHGRSGSKCRTEYTKRLGLFRQSLEKIHSMKSDGDITWKVGITLMADMTAEERMLLVGVNVTQHDDLVDRNSLESIPHSLKAGRDPPEEWDWRDPSPGEGAGSFVTDPVEQHWKNCWVYAAVTPVETLLKLHTTKLVELSTQELYDCTYGGNNKEGSGRFRDAWDWIRKSGRLGTRADIPDVKGSIPTHYMKFMYEDRRNALAGFRLGDTLWVRNEEEMIQDIYSASPVGIAMQIEGLHLDVYKGEMFLQNPSRGVECYRKSKHAMAVVGYNRLALVIKNSWGKEWGDEGYLHWVRGQGNSCGIYDVAGSITMYRIEDAERRRERKLLS